MNLSLAPIQGMTLAYYRNLYAEIFGNIDIYYSPFIATTKMREVNPVIFKDIFPDSNKIKHQIVPQLLGNNGIDFRYYASRMVDMGYKEINWNIGCPYHAVTKKLKGSGLLNHPDMIKTFLDEVCKDDSYNLSVKMRLGLNTLEEGVKVIDILNDYPLSGVTIHGRTGAQKYEGHVDLHAFDTLYSACKHEITYNGDIFTVDDYYKIQKKFPSIDRFMLARGVLYDPFLPGTIKGKVIPTEAKLDKMRTFHDGVYNYFQSLSPREKQLCDKMKEFWMYNSVHLDPTGEFIKNIKRSHSLSDYLKSVDQILSDSNVWIESI